jgi:hypothetical protein
MESCPSVFTLDDREIHGAPAHDDVVRHVTSCARCGAGAPPPAPPAPSHIKK